MIVHDGSFNARPRIVILGGGFTGVAVARRLEEILKPAEAEIVLISRENFSVFTPMLPEVTSGTLDIRHIVTPVRAELTRTRFVLADVEALDVGESTVTFRHVLIGATESLHYDQVVVTIGSSTSTFGLPGVAERVFPLKTLEDAGTLRNRLVWLLELADSTPDSAERRRLLTVAVVGGGFTGVETAGEIVELFRGALRFYPRIPRDEVRIVLIEGGGALLPGLPARMGEYASRALKNRGVEVSTGDGVTGADDEGLALQSGARIETKTIVWSAGVTPSPSVADSALPKTKHGAIVVDRDMRVPGFPAVWAAGDCAAIPDGDGGFFPQTAQHAIREGPVLAGNLANVLHGKPTKPFRYATLGMMASLGARRAVAQLPGNRVLTGFLAWFLWRTYYLSRLPGLDRKLRVAFDWTLDMVFPPDIAELRIYSRRARSSAAADGGLPEREQTPSV
ncbi:MAG: NAD(P)/FAD-dependent oxidoreductase [Vulcanimicrobiaceae bacterium]